MMGCSAIEGCHIARQLVCYTWIKIALLSQLDAYEPSGTLRMRDMIGVFAMIESSDSYVPLVDRSTQPPMRLLL